MGLASWASLLGSRSGEDWLDPLLPKFWEAGQATGADRTFDLVRRVALRDTIEDRWR